MAGWDFRSFVGRKIKIIFDDGSKNGYREAILVNIDEKLNSIIIEDSKKIEVIPIDRIIRVEVSK